MPKKKMKKFYNFNFNKEKNETDFYLYGEIISGGNDWKWDETDVTFQDVRDTLNEMEDNSTLNIYINSPGGSVFTTQGIISMLSRAKERGITVNSYIDGIGASCASWLPMIADNLYIYGGSVLMIHKPMSGCWGNADEMKEQIEILDKIENEVIIPLYMSRVKEGVTEEDIRNYMAKETWFTSNEILEIFDNITLLENNKEVVACVDRDVMKNYVNMPDNIKELLEKEGNGLKVKNVDETEEQDVETPEEAEGNEETDTSEDEQDIETASDVEDMGDEEEEDEEEEEVVEENNDAEEEEENLQKKLIASNEKVIALNDKLQELEEKLSALENIENKYNALKEKVSELEVKDKVEEKLMFYKNKFEKFDALDKFNSEEVQTLIKDCVTNEKSLSKLNEMVVEMIDVNKHSRVINPKILDSANSEIEDLIPTSNSGLSSLFE